jgi:very-short-patch-repair endonuclease
MANIINYYLKIPEPPVDARKTEYLIGQLTSIKNKVYEIAIIAPVIMDDELCEIMPVTQCHVSITGKRHLIDLYYPELKVAIEIDEPHHARQIEADQQRETNIIIEKECVFKRISIGEDFNISTTIKELKDFLLAAIKKKKAQDEFEEWEIKEYDVERVQLDYPNAVLFKTNSSEFDPEYLPFSGPLTINSKARNLANLFVAYSGNTATVVFVAEINSESWIHTPKGYYQTGEILPNHPLMSSGVTKWNTTTNKIYGEI